MKVSVRLLSQFRKPSIHFIGKRSHPSTKQAAHPHPYAPPEHQRVFSAEGSSSSPSASTSPASGGSKNVENVSTYTNFWEAPSRFWQPRSLQLQDREMDAIMSGGASAKW
ncbi:hypothetical protein BKA70DRAFT_577379 [Coprinopsis sp. MPI-PUGE-AT-0042]|nr:hypothetical protein BKA70DRAFT_577379 [Coprinopsis sp. MPI-PUGE-AT-0042]